MKSLCRQSDSVQYVLCILKWMIKFEATLLGEVRFKFKITQAYYILVMFQSWAENIIIMAVVNCTFSTLQFIPSHYVTKPSFVFVHIC